MRISRAAKKIEDQNRPLLSIGIIFKNEIRCLERCMKSLQPLRDAIPCELVMADTGSDDGSREIAKQYADIFFDFPWINDFAAARNAVMDHCTGKWYLSIDCDEWLDEDVSELVNFTTKKQSKDIIVAGLTVRNYTVKELTLYSDMMGIRMVRMDSGVRYVGEIHESFGLAGHQQAIFSIKAILHHDGYVVEGGPGGRDKQDRNMALLEQQFARNPNDLRVLVECVESSRDDSERSRYLRLAVAGVKDKQLRWESYGPPILRYNVLDAMNKRSPELEEHAALCLDWFPESPFTCIDVSYMVVRGLSDREKFSALIPWGERYLQGLSEYRKGSKQMTYSLLFGVLMSVSPVNEREVRILLSDAYFHDKQYEKSRDTLLEIEVSELNGGLMCNYIGILMNLQSQSGQEMSSYMEQLWEKITAPDAPEKRVAEHREAVVSAASHVLQKSWRAMEDKNGYHHAYTLFLPLEKKCETGLAAAMLKTQDAKVLEEKLEAVESWDRFSIHALGHALVQGAVFPLPGKTLELEEMDLLANRMKRIGDDFIPLAIESARRANTPERLAWARGLLLAAMNVVAERLKQTKTAAQAAEKLNAEIEEKPGIKEQNMQLVRAFAETERKFLPLCYSDTALSGEGMFLMPPMHRFGWYCAQAFEALADGDSMDYVQKLRAGLSANESMKPIVEFLTDNTPELQAPAPSQELRELADKVRAMLSVYDPADPVVAAIKQSEVYQKVAHLIEGIDVPAIGGLAQ